MNINNLLIANFILPLIVTVILVLLLLILILGIKYLRFLVYRLVKTENKLVDEIRTSVQTKFITASMEAEDLMNLAVEIWRMEQRLSKVTKKLDENQSKALENSMQKIKRFIDRYDLEVRDYTGQKYNTGLAALEVISVEKSPSATEDTVKETVEPAILLKGQVVKKAKVILLSKK